MTAKFTFIRHGESVDNLRSVWAGWRDSALSNHGKRQAEALAIAFTNTPLTAIYSSPLRRAFITAQALQSAQPDPKPLLSTSPLLREQHFGQGEGQRYDIRGESGISLTGHIHKGKYAAVRGRTNRFPDGESLNDVARRAEQIIEEIILPYVQRAAREKTDSIHVAFVSHGIFIAELIYALLKRDKSRTDPKNIYRGLRNTGWTQVLINTESEKVTSNLLCVSVLTHNSCQHLNGLVRQKAGIGSAVYDPEQRDIRTFFKGVEGNK